MAVTDSARIIYYAEFSLVQRDPNPGREPHIPNHRPAGDVMHDWANERTSSDTCACACAQQRARKRCEAACCVLLRVLRVVRVVRARQLPSAGPRAPQVMFTVGEAHMAQAYEGGRQITLD